MIVNIRNATTGALIYSGDFPTFKAAVQEAARLGTSLAGADLANLDLSGISLVGANMIGAKLDGSNLLGTNLHNTDLTGSSMVAVTVRKAFLLTAKLAGAKTEHWKT